MVSVQIQRQQNHKVHQLFTSEFGADPSVVKQRILAEIRYPAHAVGWDSQQLAVNH